MKKGIYPTLEDDALFFVCYTGSVKPVLRGLAGRAGAVTPRSFLFLYLVDSIVRQFSNERKQFMNLNITAALTLQSRRRLFVTHSHFHTVVKR